ncbi:hypothetical protein DFH28DRAFT_889716 [Melampsora americana]|nr:hypothetical protein DFH28DRAFT_889716 [Melampsora americana]
MINMQHNGHDSGCTLASIHSKKVERRETSISFPSIKHVRTNSFILNSAAHYLAKLHQELADLEVSQILPSQWNDAIAKGIATWKATPCPPRKNRREAVHTPS